MISYEDKATGLRMKVCTKCKQARNTPWFPRDKRRNDGLMLVCRECQQKANGRNDIALLRFGTPNPDTDRDPRIADGKLPAKLVPSRYRIAEQRLKAITAAIREGSAKDQVELACQLRMTYHNLRTWLRRFIGEGKIKHDDVPRGSGRKIRREGYYSRLRNIRMRQIVRHHKLRAQPTIGEVAKAINIPRHSATYFIDRCLDAGMLRIEDTCRRGGKHYRPNPREVPKRVLNHPAKPEFLFDTKAGQIINTATDERTPAPHADRIELEYRSAKYTIGWGQRYIPLWRIKRIETQEAAVIVQK